MTERNTLYYGDNLDVLRRHVKDESVDLIYLDPPFNSAQNYNILFEERSGADSAAQIKAFEDTWKWDRNAAEAMHAIIEAGGKASEAMQGLWRILGANDMMAYLAMMAPRLVELRRVMKPTASLYLHCDPSASHYLKILLDAIFGPENFLNEITWKRTSAHSKAQRYGPVHDIIFFYSRSDKYVWTGFKTPHDKDYLVEHFRHVDGEGRAFQPIDLTGAGVRHGDSGKPWKRINPTKAGRHWALPNHILQKLGITASSPQEALDALDEAGRIYWPKKKGGKPRLIWYVDELEGAALSDVWTDIPPISARAAERLGYPTQKPEALLERVIMSSSKEGDLVLDPFCGCGTTVSVAQRLNRRWIGIDVTCRATKLIKKRLKDAYGLEKKKDYAVVGEPTTLSEARALAKEDKENFEAWALDLVDARDPDKKKGADKGIDGKIIFHDEPRNGMTKQIIISVKGGENVSARDIRDLRGVVERENAEIGVLITMEEPTKPMRTEAASAGFYKSPWGNHPRLQILTIEELLGGKRINYPAPEYTSKTFKKAKRVRNDRVRESSLGYGAEGARPSSGGEE